MNKVIKNYLYNVSYQVMLIVLPIIVTPYVSRVLGANGVGTYSYTNSITQYFILLGCIGLNLYGQREIAYYQDDLEKRNKTFFELLFIRTITLSISTVIFCFTMVAHSKYSSIFFIQTLDIIASIFDVSWFFQGIEDFQKTVLRNFIVRIICVLLIFTFVKTAADLPIYVLCYSGTLLCGNISLWFYLPKYVKKVRLNTLNIKKHIKPALILFFPQIASSVYTLLDKTMIGLLTGNTKEVAYYEQSQTIVKTVMTVVTSLGTTLMPRIANLYKNDKKDEIIKFMYGSIKFVLVLSCAFTFGIMGISKGFVPWFFGNDFYKVIPNLIIISPIIIIIGISNVLGTQYLLAIGRQKEYTISIIIAALINFVCNFLLIGNYLSIGAAIATVLAEGAALLTQVYFLKNEFDFFYVLKMAIKYICFGLIMMLVVVCVGNLLPTSIVSTFFQIVVGGIVYLVLLFVTRDSILKFIYDSFFNRKKSN
jgi:O-antigen/teichoic acid export membrane protein